MAFISQLVVWMMQVRFSVYQLTGCPTGASKIQHVSAVPWVQDRSGVCQPSGGYRLDQACQLSGGYRLDPVCVSCLVGTG